MSKYIDVYEALCPDDRLSRDDPRRSNIIAELRAIERAKNLNDAVQVIAWWNAWPNPQFKTARDLVRKARSLMAAKKRK